MSKLLSTSLALLFFSAAFGQDYVITLKSDTLRGEARILSYDLLDRIQLSEGKKKTTYTAMQVRRAFVKGEMFAPVQFDKGIRFMKIIVPGYITLYAHRGAQQSNYDTKIMQKIGLEAGEVPNMGFKKIVSEYVSECPVVADRVKSGDLPRSQIEEIVKEYNACIATINEQRIEAASAPKHTPVGDLVEQMKTKVNASDLTNKDEVNDLLTSVDDKVKKKEPIPGYMKEGLKGYLSSREDLKEDLNQLLSLLDN